MPSRRDILKATGGLVLATAGSWLASHAHAVAPNPPGLAPLPAGAAASGDLEAIAGKPADQAELAPAELRDAENYGAP